MIPVGRKYEKETGGRLRLTQELDVASGIVSSETTATKRIRACSVYLNVYSDWHPNTVFV